jgi:hypothetical protein
MSVKINWDAVGITASAACAIHCAILPLLISSLSFFGINIIDNNAVEYFMIFLAFLIGSLSLLHGYRKHHQNYKPVALFSIGMVLLFAKEIWHEYQIWFLPLAVLLIVVGHVLNFRFCRQYVGGAKKAEKSLL